MTTGRTRSRRPPTWWEAMVPAGVWLLATHWALVGVTSSFVRQTTIWRT
ncbi:hypothetical protein [Tardiphaga sp.]